MAKGLGGGVMGQIEEDGRSGSEVLSIGEMVCNKASSGTFSSPVSRCDWRMMLAAEIRRLASVFLASNRGVTLEVEGRGRGLLPVTPAG